MAKLAVCFALLAFALAVQGSENEEELQTLKQIVRELREIIAGKNGAGTAPKTEYHLDTPAFDLNDLEAAPAHHMPGQGGTGLAPDQKLEAKPLLEEAPTHQILGKDGILPRKKLEAKPLPKLEVDPLPEAPAILGKDGKGTAPLRKLEPEALSELQIPGQSGTGLAPQEKLEPEARPAFHLEEKLRELREILAEEYPIAGKNGAGTAPKQELKLEMPSYKLSELPTLEAEAAQVCKDDGALGSSFCQERLGKGKCGYGGESIYKKTSVSLCAKTCGWCHENPAMEKLCHDRAPRSYCEETIGDANRNTRAALTACPKFFNLCNEGDPMPVWREPAKVCQDNQSPNIVKAQYCQKSKEDGKCEKSAAARLLCPKSCGQC